MANDLFKRISRTRVLTSVAVGLLTTSVGLVFMGIAMHGPEWSTYVPAAVMPAAYFVLLLGPFHSNWWMLGIFVAQSALWYGLLSIPDLIRAALQRA